MSNKISGFITGVINFMWANNEYKRLSNKVAKEGDFIKKTKALVRLSKFGDKYNIDVRKKNITHECINNTR